MSGDSAANIWLNGSRHNVDSEAVLRAAENADALNSIAENGRGETGFDRYRNRDRDTIIFPSIQKEFKTNPRQAVLNNVNPMIDRAAVEHWADDHLADALGYISNQTRRNRIVNENLEYRFMKSVVGYIKERNADISEQVMTGIDSSGVPISAAGMHNIPNPRSDVRITVEAPTPGGGTGLAGAPSSAAVREGIGNVPISVQPGDMVFSSSAAPGFNSNVVGASALRALDSSFVRGEFKINETLLSMCDTAINKLYDKDHEKFRDASYHMFLEEENVMTKFANFVGEIYLQRANASQTNRRYSHASRLKSEDAVVNKMTINLVGVLVRDGSRYRLRKSHEYSGSYSDSLTKYAEQFN